MRPAATGAEELRGHEPVRVEGEPLHEAEPRDAGVAAGHSRGNGEEELVEHLAPKELADDRGAALREDDPVAVAANDRHGPGRGDRVRPGFDGPRRP